MNLYFSSLDWMALEYYALYAQIATPSSPFFFSAALIASIFTTKTHALEQELYMQSIVKVIDCIYNFAINTVQNNKKHMKKFF